MPAKVIVRDLSKRYGGVEAVRGVSFTIEAGEIFGLLGPNGAGKTTTLECLVGLREADAGELEVCGLDVRKQPREVKQRWCPKPTENGSRFPSWNSTPLPCTTTYSSSCS